MKTLKQILSDIVSIVYPDRKEEVFTWAEIGTVAGIIFVVSVLAWAIAL